MFSIATRFSLAGVVLAYGAQASSYGGMTGTSTCDSQGGQATCTTGIVNFDVTSPMNHKLNAVVSHNQYEVTQQILTNQYPAIGPSTEAALLGPVNPTTANVDISVTVCKPKGYADSSKAVQVLTHGIGFDHSYWDFSPELSYVDTAAKYGATTVSYDRLGVGKSSTPGGQAPLQVIQAPMEVAILEKIITMLKDGTMGQYTKVVHHGHSFGAALTVGLTSTAPTAVDVAILSGFSVNNTAIPDWTLSLDLQIANQNSKRFKHLSDGYLVGQNAIGNQLAFFHYPNFTKEAAVKAEASKQTVTMGELATLSGVVLPSPQYTGAVMVANGMFDLPFCFGNCMYPVDASAAVIEMLYPSVSAKEPVIYPGSGHGLNLHDVAPTAFDDMQQFIKAQGA